MGSIYLHIPFCKQACHYCNFHFSIRDTEKERMIDALKNELVLQQFYLSSDSIETIYFGGGTPSLLSSLQIESIICKINSLYNVSPDVEITIEMNPDNSSLTYLESLRRIGVNRLSIGIQSFQSNILKYLNRAHNSQQAFNCIRYAREVGFDNISIDLMYAMPNGDMESWSKDLEIATSIFPEHISAYCLTIEPRTFFGHQHKKGKLIPVKEDFAAEQFEMLIERLSKAGYEHYETSNFCLPRKHSRHNLNYWKKGNYLGVGPSAHSYNGISRQKNVASNQKYLMHMDNGVVPCIKENLSIKDHVNEFIMLNLRTSWGCNLLELRDQYKYDLLKSNKEKISELLNAELVIISGQVLKLTRRGKLLADYVTAQLWI